MSTTDEPFATLDPVNGNNIISDNTGFTVFSGTTSPGLPHPLQLHGLSSAFGAEQFFGASNGDGTWSLSVNTQALTLFQENSLAHPLDGTHSVYVTINGVNSETELVTYDFDLPITDTAAHIHALTPLQITNLEHGTQLISTGPGDTEFSVAQAKALETDGTFVTTSAGAHVELSDSAKNVAGLLGGHTWAEVEQHITQLQATGITDVNVQLPHNHEFEFALSDAFHLAEQQLALHGTESVAQQTKEIAQVEHHDWHL